jgi:phosphoribosylanthranilate isomerase
MTCIEDALAAAALGVDAIGVVLTRRSPRSVGIEQAREICRAMPPFVATVALFMDDDPAFVSEAVSAIAPTLLQFHGSELPADCVRYGRPYLKSVAMGRSPSALEAMDGREGSMGRSPSALEAVGGDWRPTVALHSQATAFVFDGHAAGQPGGSGQRFDWSTLPAAIGKPIVLAGGLVAENVAAAIREARPYAVDVASGIESAPGRKDELRMRRFMAAVRKADEEG